MKKSDLKTGMIVKTREGHHHRVFLDSIVSASYGKTIDKLVKIEPGISSTWMELKSFDDDLTYKGNLESNNTIMEVLVSKTSCDLVENYSLDAAEVIWKREEVREMTMEELEKEFGCKIKVVKEHIN